MDDIEYINYETIRAAGRWDRRTFLQKWWHIYAEDIRWVPPYYPALRRAIEPSTNSHVARMNPLFVYNEAFPTRQQPTRQATHVLSPAPSGFSSASLTNTPLAAAAILMDPRRDDGTGYLAMLHCRNVTEGVERLLWEIAEDLRPRGCRRLIGPLSLSAHICAGALQDHWEQYPPMYTPYNPPYVPEVLERILRRTDTASRLYTLPVPDDVPERSVPAEIVPFELDRLHEDLLPLFQDACTAQSSIACPPPDVDETRFMLRWLRTWPASGWVAILNGESVGFVLLQPDYAPDLHRANGGRNPFWRLWLRLWAANRPTRAGRLLFGVVTAAVRRRGIGTQLLLKALKQAHAQGWSTLSVGPIPETAEATHAFLRRHGAQPGQTYRLYEWRI